MRRTRPAAVLLVAVALAVPGRAAAEGAAIPVHGRVVDAAGAPLAGVPVELVPYLPAQELARLGLAGGVDAEPIATASTRTDGRFRLDAPAAGMWRVLVRPSGGVPLEASLVPLLEPVTLPPAERVPRTDLRVRVVGPDRAPAPGATVELRRGAPGHRWSRAASQGWRPAGGYAVADAEGRVALPVAEHEAPRVVARAPGRLPASGLPEGGRLELVLPPGVPRTLRVAGPAGGPVAGAVVAVGEEAVPVAVTAEDGRADAALPASGEVELTLDAGGGWSFAAPLPLDEVPAGAEVPLLLPFPPRVAGRVVSAASGEPLPGAWVWPTADPGRAVRADGDGGFELPDGREGGVEVGAAAIGHRTATLEADPASPSRVEFALPAEGALSGTVVDPTGGPVAEAAVEARSADRHPTSWELDSSPRLHGLSDERGRFRIAGVEPGASRELRVTAEGFAPSEAVATAGEPVRIVLHPGASVTGQVFDAYGQPVPGAEALLFRVAPGGEIRLETRDGERVSAADAATGVDGRFALRHVPGGAYDLRVRAPGRAPRDLTSIEVPDDGALDLGRIDLGPAVEITGRVVDPDGEPVAGATVAVDRYAHLAARVSSVTRTSSGNPKGVTTDTEGRFTVGDLAPGLAVDLRVAAPGFRNREVAGIVPPTDEPVTVELPRGVRVHGVLVDHTGAPVPRGVLEYRIESETTAPGSVSQRRSLGSSTADAEGRFDLTGLEPGSLTLTVLEPGGGAGSVALSRTVEEGEVVGPLRLELAEGPAVEGTVVTADGRPAVRVPVSLIREWTGRRGSSSTEHRTTTDARGAFRFSGLAPGPATLRAEGPGGIVALRDVVVGDGDLEVELRLEPSREPSIAGRVLDPEGRPVAGAQVILRTAGESPRGEPAPDERPLDGARTDRTGGFRFERLDPGRYRLDATADVHAPASPLEVVVDEGDHESFELRLRPGARVEGRIVGLEPGEGNRFGITAHPAEAEGDEAWARSRPGRVDHAGRFAVDGLTPGPWRIVARDGQAGLAIEETVEIGSDLAAETLDLELPGGLALTGRVLVNGEPAPGSRVTLERVTVWDDPADVFQPRTVSTRYDGGFRFEGLDEGSYRLRLGTDESREVDLRADREVVFELSAVRVAGRVLDAAGRPVSGVIAELRRDDPTGELVQGVATGSDGRFVFPAVAPGRYRVEASGPSGSAAVPLAIDRLDVEGLELVLRR